MITVRKPARAPAVLRERGAAETATLTSQSRNFKNDIYAHATVRAALIEAQHGKCCYCESRIAHTGSVIEHFRPKTSVRQSPAEAREHPGYYWLAYSWKNLYLACNACNEIKSDVFPLSRPDRRARGPGDGLGQERTIFVDPRNDPSPVLGFAGPTATPAQGRERGRLLIRYLGLNRPALEERRREHLRLVEGLRNVLLLEEQVPRTAENAAKFSQVRDRLAAMCSDSGEYTAMVRGALG